VRARIRLRSGRAERRQAGAGARSPKHPATKARLEHVQEAEAKLDVAALATAAAEAAERLEVTP
jgi:hypothetical protein